MRGIQSRLLCELKVNADKTELDLLEREVRETQSSSEPRTDRKLSKTTDFSAVFPLKEAINLRLDTFLYSIAFEKINWLGTAF